MCLSISRVQTFVSLQRSNAPLGFESSLSGGRSSALAYVLPFFGEGRAVVLLDLRFNFRLCVICIRSSTIVHRPFGIATDCIPGD